ncbi:MULTISPECIES: hypothetical protein [Moorena]|uniref:Uncharacterized protein n=1 Tax=Moorena producens (strain JHB) TaxID=1454205 RepID=A0A9Q9SU34_MOOP1|nr:MULTISPECIES: hypothetical protein [Moorena]NES43465.1 hypothetical protein [Moorena sp. SIO2C4]WAN69682.1 hypothetical protein BJP36_36935 [Moorena producens JHB]
MGLFSDRSFLFPVITKYFREQGTGNREQGTGNREREITNLNANQLNYFLDFQPWPKGHAIAFNLQLLTLKFKPSTFNI